MGTELERAGSAGKELDLQFDLHDGFAWMTKEGDAWKLGPVDQVAEEMARFLAEIDFGER